MRIVFFGSAEFGIRSLQAISSSRHELVRVFTQPAQRAGRGRKKRPTPVADWCEQNDVPCTEAQNINTPDKIEQVRQCRGDLLVVIAFGQKISQEVIDLFPHKAINVHASLLPKYRGAAPINRAIIEGEPETGITIITLAQKMDAGCMLAKASTPIREDDNAATIHDRLANLSPGVLLETIDKIEAGTAEYTPQDESQATLARKLQKSDGYIDWTRPADRIRNLIRGMWPWPGAQSIYVSQDTGRSYRVNIAQAKTAPAVSPEFTTPGMLDENLNVVCGQGALELLWVKPAGSNMMDFKSFVNGHQTRPGDLFLPLEQIRQQV